MHSFTCILSTAAFAENALLGKATRQPTYLVSKVIDGSCTLVQVITAAIHCCHSAFNLQPRRFLEHRPPLRQTWPALVLPLQIKDRKVQGKQRLC